MFNLKRNLITLITISAMLILLVVNCSKDQNTFLPYTRVNLRISLVNYNHLMIPGNSVLFRNEGYKGIIVVCTDPNSPQYFAYDACCPYEKDYSGVVTIQPVKNLPSPPYTVFSSEFFGICNKCGSKFNLMANGQPVEGPANHYLQSYNVIVVPGSLVTVTN
jgi:hypothetical protein